MSSWLYKLRRKRSCEEAKAAASQNPQQKPPPPSPATPNRASYYFPSGSREPKQQNNPKLRETRFPRSPQPGDLVFDVVARRDDDMFRAPPGPMHELKLRPIITRAHAGDDDSSSGTATTTQRRRMRRRLHRLHASRKKKPAEKTGRWVYESVVMVKESAEPEEDFLASMAEMIAANDDVRSTRGLQDLLACYLALNAADHHRAIVAAFRRACGRQWGRRGDSVVAACMPFDY